MRYQTVSVHRAIRGKISVSGTKRPTGMEFAPFGLRRAGLSCAVLLLVWGGHLTSKSQAQSSYSTAYTFTTFAGLAATGSADGGKSVGGGIDRKSTRLNSSHT